MSSAKVLFVRIIVVVSYLGMVAVNALANILPLNGINTGAISDSYPNLFAPIGFTFSIWGLIYLLLAAHVLYQLGLFRSKAPSNPALVNQVGIVFSISSLINIAWIFSWHYQIIPLSMLLMLLLLVCLILLARMINGQKLDMRERFFIRLPFSVYFGWITVATIANATILLVSLGWDGFGLPASLWTIIILAVGALIGTATMFWYKDIAYGLVLIWAYVGILCKHILSTGFANQYPEVVVGVIVCLVVFVVALIYTFFAARTQRRKE